MIHGVSCMLGTVSAMVTCRQGYYIAPMIPEAQVYGRPYHCTLCAYMY